MKIDRFTSLLIILGISSLISVVQANTIIYLTGSPIARTNIYAAALMPSGGIFVGGGMVVSPAPNNTGNANLIVYEGTISNISGTVDIDCSFNSSEIGIAAVAGMVISQDIPLDPNGNGVYLFPGQPVTFLTQASGWINAAQLSAGSSPDLTMTDTSQTVSLTKTNVADLTNYGKIGIVPYTFMKGYEATPDAAWTNLINAPWQALNLDLADGAVINASAFTGSCADSGDGIAIIGENAASGTRVNTLLNAAQLPVLAHVDQWTWDGNGNGTQSALYPIHTPGTLTFPGNTAAGQTLVDIGNDGYDSGESVAQTLSVDGTGSGILLIGYVVLSDAQTAIQAAGVNGAGSGPAVFLKFDGVYESDCAVINGAYPFWGQEHILGQVTPSAAAGSVAAAIKSGVVNQLTISGAGTATGDVSTNPQQSPIIPVALMQVSRKTDSGVPSQSPFPLPY